MYTLYFIVFHFYFYIYLLLLLSKISVRADISQDILEYTKKKQSLYFAVIVLVSFIFFSKHIFLSDRTILPRWLCVKATNMIKILCQIYSFYFIIFRIQVNIGFPICVKFTFKLIFVA